jgi:tRNA (guanine-N7-)-methyltransferase
MSKYMRQIKSFVKREGRLTLGQQRALETLWPIYGREVEQGYLPTVVDRVLEIGFGNGQSLLQMAVAAPSTQFIGVEVHRPGVGSLLMGIEQEGLQNVLVYQQDALDVLQHCIEDDSLSRVQLYFPDPWPKKKHHKRRIVQPEFVALVQQKLKHGGVFHLATDWQAYAEHMLEVMSQAPGFINFAENGEFSTKPDFRPTTKFEMRGQRLGHGVWDLLFRKG